MDLVVIINCLCGDTLISFTPWLSNLVDKFLFEPGNIPTVRNSALVNTNTDGIISMSLLLSVRATHGIKAGVMSWCRHGQCSLFTQTNI